ncbi:alpha/beta fold hydrolase [Leifsonia sp. C5G2]|uniref:alpha/beta fold hydrolase n=1 Tax=Leifsonia sp. C5G2 TaxID=2735269 RepID=UPI001584A449|nr:alpha/beta fold hydrolase [Leifsonia sp. C5G2]NUU07255.1 alpha/beta hydrolase [Leifsonia sp. C5G2]
MSDRTIRLGDGRLTGFSAIGDPVGRRLVILCHPTPGAAGFDPDPPVSRSSGAHIVALDRPGYGSSERVPEAAAFTPAGWADEVAEFLKRTEQTAASISTTDFQNVGVIGWREGGLFAAALAARHPELVDRVAFVGSPAPARLSAAAGTDPADWLDESRFRTGRDDTDAYAYTRRIQRMLADATLSGAAGIENDLAAFHRADVDFSAIASDNLFVYGMRDDIVTVRDATWYRENVPNTVAYRSRTGGRDLIRAEWRRILDHVAPRRE